MTDINVSTANPDDIYAWDAHDTRQGRQVCGVTDRPEQATRRLADALAELSPDAWGTIRAARLECTPKHDEFRYGRVLARLRLNPASGQLERMRRG
ncbi:hypothetical protein [Streptomyces albidoflavus]|uniref:hypothetical protein n=1 Tax=Streptomyces albidoflavus TaxID=1886 RepID=UPI00332F1755